MNFEEFFKAATGHAPFDYQCRLACGDQGDRTREEWLSNPNPNECRSLLINIPTGLGKTAAVVLAWLWNRIALQKDLWPRRLVYCLPMRTLVEQTEGEVKQWLAARDLLWDGKPENRTGKVGVHILMGGEEAGDWDIYPEENGILIGTQDMLLSRALNRGYGMSRARWPMHFGLLNNDCLWVFDEVQLMGNGLPTTAQLEAFRNDYPTAAPCRTWWMSATSERAWLQTVDFQPGSLAPELKLEEEDCEDNPHVRQLLQASKPIEKARTPAIELKRLAQEVLEAAKKASGLTIVVVNTVKRARALWLEVNKRCRNSGFESKPFLLHSRFRPEDRARRIENVLNAEGQPQLIISTQVIEAGVNISASTLFTELAPWSSLVQRFGRCNRRGLDAHARIVWFDTDNPTPYRPEQLAAARKLLEGEHPIRDAKLENLKNYYLPKEDRPQATQVIRRKDFIELFDTTPDLAGNDIDIDRWVRETDDSSVQVFWRDWKDAAKGQPPPSDDNDFPGPERTELCPVSIAEFRDFVKKSGLGVWRWNFLDGEWERTQENSIFPGQIYLLHTSAGGYGNDTGWNPTSKEPVESRQRKNAASNLDQNDADLRSQTDDRWQSIAEHTNDVCQQLEKILCQISVPEKEPLVLAARYHDLGKTHASFQSAIKVSFNGQQRPADWVNRADVAKAPKKWWKRGYQGRRHFRHELASALAILHPDLSFPLNGAERDLTAYLVAAHHGKVRLSIRSLPGENIPENERRFARGVWDNDQLPPPKGMLPAWLTPLPVIDLGTAPDGTAHLVQPIKLSLEPMELGLGQQPPFTGLPSWTERMLALRDNKELGPFRLGFLETLLRAADERASALAKSAVNSHLSVHDFDGTNPAMASTASGNTPATQVAGGAGGRFPEHADGGRTSELVLAEGSTRPYGTTRHLETTFGILSLGEVAERLALRAVEIEHAILAGHYAQSGLDDTLVLTLHRDLCGHLVPEWAGLWRSVEVTVGEHKPPAPHIVRQKIRDYAADLAARWAFIIGTEEDLLLESLAFAEGRLLSIHPFRDFNGRVTRLFLLEILRRAELPFVRLAVRDDEEKRRYFGALRAADTNNWIPLIQIWRERFDETASTPHIP